MSGPDALDVEGADAADVDWRKTAETLQAEVTRLRTALHLLIDRHTSTTGEHPIAVAELHNVLTPGSRPMLPERPGHGATCSICAPDGSTP